MVFGCFNVFARKKKTPEPYGTFPLSKKKESFTREDIDQLSNGNAREVTPPSKSNIALEKVKQPVKEEAEELPEPENLLPAAIPLRRKRVFAPKRVKHQNKLTIPIAIFEEMIKHPQLANFWGTFIQTCKYPFFKNQILPVDCMKVEKNLLQIGRNADFEAKSLMKLNLADFSCKLWLTDRLVLEYPDDDFNFPHLYCVDLKQLVIMGPVQRNLFQALAAESCETISVLFMGGDIKNPDGSLASLDEIFENFQNIKTLGWFFGANKTIKTAADVQQFLQYVDELKNLKVLALTQIPEYLFLAFLDFLGNNHIRTVSLDFLQDISSNYKATINGFIEELSQNPDARIPQIHF